MVNTILLSDCTAIFDGVRWEGKKKVDELWPRSTFADTHATPPTAHTCTRMHTCAHVSHAHMHARTHVRMLRDAWLTSFFREVLLILKRDSSMAGNLGVGGHSVLCSLLKL